MRTVLKVFMTYKAILHQHSVQLTRSCKQKSFTFHSRCTGTPEAPPQVPDGTGEIPGTGRTAVEEIPTSEEEFASKLLR